MWHYNWYHRNTKDCKKLLWRTVCQEIWKPRWNGHICRKIQSSKNEWGKAEKLNRPITADEIAAVIKKHPAHKHPEPDVFTGEFYKAFKEELTPILHRLFQKKSKMIEDS